MLIASFDLGNTTGYALNNGKSRTMSLLRKKDVDVAEALFNFRNKLPELLKNVNEVILERPFYFYGGKNFDFLTASTWEVHIYAFQHNIKRFEYSASTVRKSLINLTKKPKEWSINEFDQKIKEAVLKEKSFKNLSTSHEIDAAALIVHHLKVRRNHEKN